MPEPLTALDADWLITRCASGGCIHLHVERTVITMTPAETVRLARLLNSAVVHYGLTEGAVPAPEHDCNTTH